MLVKLANKASQEEEATEEKTILFTEVMSKLINPKIDDKIRNAYRTCFFYFTKSFSGNPQMKKVVVATYKELFKQYFQG